MDIEVIEKIDVIDEKGGLYMSFENNKSGLYRLSMIYNLNYIIYENNPSQKNFNKVLLLTALYHNIFLAYEFYLEQKDPILKNFINKVNDNYRFFYELEIANNSKIGQDFNFYKLLVSNFRFVTNYCFQNFENIEDFEIENLVMSYENFDHEIIENDPDDDEIDEDEVDENNLSHRITVEYELIYTHPLHPKVLDILRNKILTISDSEDLMTFTMYCEEYIKQARKDDKFKGYEEKLDELRKIVSISKQKLKIIKANFDEIYKTYLNSISFKKTLEPTIYNDSETFVSTVLANFLNSKDDTFFDELKKMFNNFNESSEVDCMYVIKNFEDLLKKYNLETEIKCLKHLVSENNIVEFAQDLYFSYQTIIKTPKFIKTFNNKHNRNTDNNDNK